MIQWVFFKLDIARKVCWMCHVSCLWFNDKRVLIFSHRNNHIFGAKHYLRKVRLVSAKLWVYWAESYCGLTWPGHAEITVSLLVPKVNKSFNNLLHTTSETILCIFWILSLTLLSNLGSNLIPQFSELSVTQCKYMWTRSFEWILFFWKHHIYLPFDITIVIHSKHPRKAEL